MISYILAILSSLVVLVGDYISKEYVAANFELFETRPFINGLINLDYIHNQGAAWGIFSGNTVFLIIFTFVVMALCVFFLIKFANKSKLFFWAVSLVLSGGMGNMYDRIFRNGEVIDFLHFEFWPTFPIFNVADCAVVVGTGLLILYFVLDTVKEFKEKRQKDGEN